MLPPPALNWYLMQGLKTRVKINPSQGGFMWFYCSLLQGSDVKQSAQWTIMVAGIYYYPKAVFWLSELMHGF
jgi:hypothetical protein